ncbi:hypothetical protein [Jiella avicenniae]|uniref:Uncharacterized protein n=1 Tax=Jiella avicenniae TaxID=2907202 RepID=A0A9X1NYG6_9HYPH|nr:hypothetical protein [Jiella avicenniae]MCE7027035.1 hypothetical protein [Jiella avicenniae]
MTLLGGLAALSPSLAAAQTAAKTEDRLAAEPEALADPRIATAGRDARLRIHAPRAPTRLSLVLAPSAVDPGETVFVDVYLQQADAETQNAEDAGPGTARLSEADRSRLAGTVAFTKAEAVGEEEYFVVNVPPGMRFETGAAIVTLTLSGADAPLRNSAVELRQATLLR